MASRHQGDHNEKDSETCADSIVLTPDSRALLSFSKFVTPTPEETSKGVNILNSYFQDRGNNLNSRQTNTHSI